MTETALAKIDYAKRALVEAKDLSEVLEIRDRAAAMVVYAQAKGAGEAAQLAKELQLRAERKAGAFLVALKDTGELGRGGSPVAKAQRVTLGDLSIERIESQRWQTAASVPEKTFDTWLEETKAAGRELTQAGLLRLASARHVPDDTYEWFTPPEHAAAVRDVLGGIDLDPASCAEANETVQAREFYGLEDDALSRDWHGRVYLNPPYNMPLIERFVSKLVDEYDMGRVEEAVLLTNNATDTKWFHCLAARFPMCFTRGRVHFVGPDGQPGLATRQGQVFFHLPTQPDGDSIRFRDMFGRFGVILREWREGAAGVD